MVWQLECSEVFDPWFIERATLFSEVTKEKQKPPFQLKLDANSQSLQFCLFYHFIAGI